MCYYCLHKFHWEPEKYLSLDKRQKAFILAAIECKAEAEKEAKK